MFVQVFSAYMAAVCTLTFLIVTKRMDLKTITALGLAFYEITIAGVLAVIAMCALAIALKVFFWVAHD